MVSSVLYSNPAEEKTEFDHNMEAKSRKKKIKKSSCFRSKRDKNPFSEGLFLSNICTSIVKKEAQGVYSAAASAALMAIYWASSVERYFFYGVKRGLFWF